MRLCRRPGNESMHHISVYYHYIIQCVHVLNSRNTTHQHDAVRPDLVGPEAVGDDGPVLSQELSQLHHRVGSGQVLHVDEAGGGVAGRGRGATLHWGERERERA